MNFCRFDIFRIDTGVADMRVGKGNDLAAVTGVCQDFLITRHRRIENNFATGMAFSSNGNTMKNGAISECKYGRRCIGVKKWRQG